MESTEYSLILGLAILLLLFLITVGLLLIYSGLLYDVVVKTGTPYIKRVVVAYKFQQGPMSECGAVFSEASSIAPLKMQIGIYYDNPDKVPKEKLRWAVAAVISDEDGVVDEELWKAFQAKKYQKGCLPEVKTSVNSVFPHTSMISILLGVFKVYPKLNTYCTERGLLAFPYLEIYDKGYINYMAPLENHIQFFVPEAVEKMEEVLEYYTEEELSVYEEWKNQKTSTPEDQEQSDPEPFFTEPAAPVETSSSPPVETSSITPAEKSGAPLEKNPSNDDSSSNDSFELVDDD